MFRNDRKEDCRCVRILIEDDEDDMTMLCYLLDRLINLER